MRKDSFVLYKSFYEPLKTLSDKQLGKLFKAIFEYQINGNTDVDFDIQMAFAFIKNQLDIDNSKYQEKVKKNSNNGRKGGRPPKTENQAKKANGKNKSEKSERLLNKAKKADNDNDNDNDLLSNPDGLLCETSQPHAENINYKALVDFFNSETKGVFGCLRGNLSENRKGMIRARIREHGKDTFAEAIKKASQSDYLKSGAFNCTFDWIIKPTNFEKIISGNYDNKNRRNNANSGISEDLTRNILEGLARAEYEKQQQ